MTAKLSKGTKIGLAEYAKPKLANALAQMEKSVMLIAGPMGCGKTTNAKNYIDKKTKTLIIDLYNEYEGKRRLKGDKSFRRFLNQKTGVARICDFPLAELALKSYRDGNIIIELDSFVSSFLRNNPKIDIHGAIRLVSRFWATPKSINVNSIFVTQRPEAYLKICMTTDFAILHKGIHQIVADHFRTFINIIEDKRAYYKLDVRARHGVYHVGDLRLKITKI